jgi:hypothetical protein
MVQVGCGAGVVDVVGTVVLVGDGVGVVAPVRGPVTVPTVPVTVPTTPGEAVAVVSGVGVVLPDPEPEPELEPPPEPPRGAGPAAGWGERVLAGAGRTGGALGPVEGSAPEGR